MKAAVMHDYNENLSIEDVEEPQINGSLDVVVRIAGAGLCRTDLHIIQGMWKDQAGVEPEFPHILGHENAGWIEAVGDDVTHVQVGDAVICHPQRTCGLCLPCREGDDMHCANSLFSGLDVDGGFAELMKTHARSVLKLPEGLDPKQIAPHADAGLTAIHAVKKAARILGAGDQAVLIGPGGLGHIGIQCFKAYSPAELIVIATSQDSLDQAKELGADHGVIADEDQVDNVLELTNGEGARAVLDFVGEFGVIEYAKQMLRSHGTYYVIGYGDQIQIEAIKVIFQEYSFVGNLVGTYVDLHELMQLHAKGKVELTTEEFALEEANEAINALEEEKLQGRGVLIPQ